MGDLCRVSVLRETRCLAGLSDVAVPVGRSSRLAVFASGLVATARVAS
jgi:hypothetical protein